MPLGRRAGLAASLATSWMVRVSLVAGAENTPSANFTALASTLRAKAAISRVFAIEPETVADDLLEHGLVALPLVDRSREQGDGAAAVEPDLGTFTARRTC